MSDAVELVNAMSELMKAGPDVEKVKALTAETLAAKKTNPPVPMDEMFAKWGTRTPRGLFSYTCQLCGVSIEGSYERSVNCPETRSHHKWHNDVEARLRKIDEVAHVHSAPEDAPEAPAEEHHPRGDCYARAERSYTSQPHELNVNGPYGKFTRNP